jgi:hypothetical protein
MIFFYVFLAVLVGGIGLYFYLRKIRRKRFLESLQLKLYLIRLPLGSKEGKDVRKEIAVSEQLITALAAFDKPVIFEVAVPYIGKEIHFYAAVPERFGESLAKQVRALWSEAEVSPAEDYNIFNYSGAVAAAFISQKEKIFLPIRTFEEIGADTFLPMLGGLAEIEELGEGGAIQFVISPAGSSAKGEIKSVLKVLKNGWSLKDVLGHPLSFSLSDFSEAISPKGKKEQPEKTVDENAVKAVEMKISKPLFKVNIRLVASAATEYKAEAILSSLSAGFSQFSAPLRNELRVVKPRNIQDLLYKFSFRDSSEEQAMVLNSEELSSLFHLPTPFTDVPRIKYLKSKEAAPSLDLGDEGVVIGESVFRGEKKQVMMSENDRRRHIYIIGQTGTGKSNLMVNMVVQDIRNGKGVAVVDPHGELVNDVLGLVPKNRLDDVIVFDPSDLERPLGLNMIEYDLNRPEEKTFIVNEMQSIFNKLFTAETMGPMFEQYMRNALLLLMEDAHKEPATLMEVARVFTDAEFRNRKLARIMNPAVIDFWQKEATKAGGEASLANMTPYITSKFNNFTANDYIRVIIGQTTSAFRFREAMDEGKIILVNLSKGRIGDINANLLGMIIVGKILMAALGRANVSEDKRKDFNLYIDEFQNFTTDSISVILSEARKYRLNLTIAHQFIAQLTDKIKDSVFGNVGSVIAFRVGVQDADFLVKQFEPVFGQQDLINIDNFNAYVRLLIKGTTSRPFNIRTLPAEKGSRETAAKIRDLSREKYGRSREEVEAEIYRRLRT